jgi:hypothetical protein
MNSPVTKISGWATMKFNPHLILVLSTLLIAACGGGGDNAKPPTSADSVICDTFELATNIRGSVLGLSLNTDLPDDTVISVTVDRSYWKQGDSEEHSRRYFAQESTVGEWRSTHEINIAAEGWTRDLKDFQEKMANAAVGFEVARISDDIDVSIIAPVNMQTNAAFGDRNKNLSGKAVTIMSYGRLVRGDTQLAYPL